MENKRYLNEEQFQKTNKKVKTAGLIAMIVGIVMLVIGLFFIKVPEMGQRGWQQASTTKTVLIVFGQIVIIFGCIIRFIIGNQRKISAYMMQQQMPIAQEGLEKMSPSMGKAAKEITKGVKEGLKDTDEK